MHNEYLEPLWDAFGEYASYPAIVDRDGSRETSYAQLEAAVRRAMAWLGEQPLEGRAFIPVSLPSSMEYIAAEIAIWMCGHTAVPMGPAFPEERVEYICGHCEAPFVIDAAAQAHIDAMEPASFEGSPSYPDEKLPALLIYTSGSTGTPKGILHTFEGLATKHTSKVALTYSPEDHWGMGAPLYFVASLTVYKVLKEGGQLHLLSPETYRDIRRVEDYFVEHEITHTFLSPSMLAAFHNRAKSLRLVFTGSERLSGQCSRDGYKLMNCFGMTETAGTVTAFLVKEAFEVTPVGKPQEEWCLLDDDGNPVPEGEEGELCLRGTYCAGYYKDAARTEELYRGGWLHTGDLMRMLPDGNLVYVNRKDWMAKINGQRVEPGEVESALTKLDGVEQAVVKAFDADGGGQYLCAFYRGEADADELRSKLAATLPPYMVPSHFVAVERFSLLPNGKVNRKVLPAPELSELRSAYEPPQTEVEKTLCEAFGEVFGLERVGVNDDFYLLGGDSIRVMRLQALCEELPLSSKIVARERTPRKIAAALESAAAPEAGAGATAAPHSAPLTQTQLGIYVESMARPHEPSYNNPVLLRLDPSLDEERLARALEAAIDAHSFVKLHIEEDEAGDPLMVAGNEPCRVPVERMSADELEALKERLVEPFDLHHGPLYRARVIRTPEDLYLFCDFHHIIYDGTSMRIIMDDVNAAYAGGTPEPERYTGFDLALEERRLRATEAYDEAKAWYQETFGGLDLQSKPQPDRFGEGLEFGTLEHDLALEAGVVERFCKRMGVTQNVLATAAFGVVLGAYGNAREALFATIYNGRSDLRTKRTVDMMVKTLPVYSRWDGTTRVQDYLRATKEQLLSAMENDLYSFAELAATTDANSDVLFAYQGDYLALGNVCGGAYERVELPFNATGSALNCQLFVVDGKLQLRVEYQANQYSQSFVRNLAHAYGTVLRALLSVERVDDVELADEGQLAELDAFNRTERPYDDSQTVVSLFRAAAQAHPESTAFIFEDLRYSYRQLDELSDRVAGQLVEAGLTRGDVVSVLVDRGPWMAVASLGAQKAGCAYQPLDATYPPERLSFMVADAHAGMLIASKGLRELVSGYDGPTMVVGAPEDLPACSVALPEGPDPEDLLILLYTSGTTGVPKGVRLLHRNLVCFITWYQRYFGLDAQGCVGAYASFGFDACMMDLFCALTCGASVCVVPEDMRLNLMAMADYFERNGVTHAFMTTQVGRQFAQDATVSTLKFLSMGGETLVPFDPPAEPACYNAYGPTECTIFSSVYPIRGGERSLPIGAPLDNMRAYVVGLAGKRLPVGAAGELWLAGPQIGDGYLNRPEKTAEVFLANPFCDDPQSAYSHLYRTGDIVRWMPDGKIEFIGRRDGQVKIRGFRIELSEVEAVVREFPGVRDATVAAFDHPSGGKYVAAYVVADEPLDVDALGDFIRARKPPYMVPAATVQLERIPLNQNGKVNRRALPEPNLSAQAEALPDDARPLNALEQELHAIVADILGTQAFGVTTPLAQCGLTSIQTIKLLTLVYKRFGVDIQPKELSGSSSLQTIENFVLDAWMKGGGPSQAQAPAQPREFRAPLTFAQTGVYYECLKHPESVAYNIPALLRFERDTDPQALAKAAEAVVAAHPVLNTHFVREGEDVFLVPADKPFAAEVRTTDSEGLAALRDSFVRPFDLDAGPLARITVASAEDGTYLLADFHHLAFDGASMGIFLQDLQAALGGEPVEAEGYSYADRARDEQAFAASEEFQENGAYVAELLKDFEAATELSADVRGRREAGRRKELAEPFDLALVEQAGRRLGVTPAGLMLAATSYALSRFVNDRNVFVATISNGRADVRTARTVGMFVNTLPLHVELADVSAGDFVRTCAAALDAAREHEAYPFARVSADFGFAPQVMYEYQVGVVEFPQLPGLVGVESLEGDAAKFKLTIRIEEQAGQAVVAIAYDDALYTEELVRSLARSIAIASEGLAAGDSAPVRSLSLLDDARREQLAGFHQEATGEPAFRLYHEGLELQAQARPHERALVACDGTFTFAELNALANRIAHALMQRGVAPRSRVALLLPRTSRVVAAIFGVMKAGCAYIPCDPAYPVERVNHILGDSAAALVVTTADRVPGYANAVDVEELLACTDDTNPRTDVGPDDLAYLIYTSGSTGKPKGVMLTHAGVCNFHTNHPANILVDALVRKAHAFLSVTTLSFDMSVKELGTPLVNGLAVVLADESQVNDPAKLAKLFRETGADAFNATHSRLRQYLELPAFARAIAGCSVVLSGGEKYTEGLLPLLQKTTDATIINTYGPTETCVSSNMADLTHAERISVGRPLYNVWECVVDADGNELPVGVVGELYIGGPGVARGYNGLPDKTKEAFVEWQGRRMYRSGDYARWTNEGFVEILGRTDNQIKLRGLRIELGEVESALAAVDGITAAVVKIAQIRGVEHLCAYYVASRPMDAGEVRDEVSKTLAGYMVPTAYRQLDALPLTPNGKVDLRSLPAAELYRSGEVVAAQGEVEQAFCDIFRDILGLEDVGATDSFFEIGGTSLMAIRVTVEAEKLGYAVTYGDVFANPSPRALAALCGEGAAEKDAALERDAEVEDFDYADIDGLLAANTLRSFAEGASRELGDVLITGATGFLGVHVLHEYLESTTGTAWCLLRGHADLSAERRLAQQLFYYFERDYTSLFGTRIRVLDGDVTRPLALPEDARVDTVINCAAVVKHFSSGTEIEDVNVGGVANLVELCLERGATLVQVSTGSTMKAPLKPGIQLVGKTNERQLFVGQDLQNKYVRSKFLAERLVLDAIVRRGLKAKIMRVGNLAPRTSDGEFQINTGTNASMGRLKSYALLECAPYDQLDSTMEFSPIDETARAILLLARTPERCVVFHAFNHHPVYMGDVFLAMGEAGLTVRSVERDAFVQALHEAEADPEKAKVLTSMLAYARRPTGGPVVVPQAENGYTMQVLYRLGFHWNATSYEYVGQFLQGLVTLGFFDGEEQ